MDQQNYKFEVYEHLARGMEDIKNGRYEDIDVAFDDIFAFLDEYETKCCNK